MVDAAQAIQQLTVWLTRTQNNSDMKKFFIVLIVSVMAVTVLFTGCGSKNNEGKKLNDNLSSSAVNADDEKNQQNNSEVPSFADLSEDEQNTTGYNNNNKESISKSDTTNALPKDSEVQAKANTASQNSKSTTNPDTKKDAQSKVEDEPTTSQKTEYNEVEIDFSEFE